MESSAERRGVARPPPRITLTPCILVVGRFGGHHLHVLLGVCQPSLSSPCQEPYRTKHTLMPGWFWCVSQRGYFPECKPQGAPAEYPERPPGQQPHAMRRTSHAGKRVFSVSNTRARVPSKENTRTSVWANDYQSQTRKMNSPGA